MHWRSGMPPADRATWSTSVRSDLQPRWRRTWLPEWKANASNEGLLRRGLEFWQDSSEIILVEGIGGLMSPVSDHLYVADLAEAFGFPLVIVSRNVLGTINQTLQTVIAAATFRNRKPVCADPPTTCDLDPPYREKCGLAIAGVVLNHPAPPAADDVSLATNRAELTARCVAPILAEVAWNGDRFDVPVDWSALGNSRRIS